MIPDAPADPEYTFDWTSTTLSGNLFELGAIQRASMNKLPTAMTVWYMDTSQNPWVDAVIDPVVAPGVEDGTLLRIPQEIRLQGIFSRSQATRVGLDAFEQVAPLRPIR